MKYITALLPLLIVVCAARANGQNPPKKDQLQKTEDVVVVTTNLVQVDAVVTDKSGR